MALQINTGLTTTDGGTIDSGAHVRIDIKFRIDEPNKYVASYKIWRNKEAYDNKNNSIIVKEILKYGFTREFTKEEFSTLSPQVIHEHVKEHLETFVGVGNVEIII
jgi:hypothetical protein